MATARWTNPGWTDPIPTPTGYLRLRLAALGLGALRADIQVTGHMNAQGAVDLHIHHPAEPPLLDVVVQESRDGITWVDRGPPTTSEAA